MDGDNPDGKWALDLFAIDPTYEQNFIAKHYTWILGVFTAVGVTGYMNYFQSRPIFASLPRYGVALTVGLITAKVLVDAKYHREAERDMVIRHYIKLHPEDFPAPVRKTYNEELRDWTPCR